MSKIITANTTTSGAVTNVSAVFSPAITAPTVYRVFSNRAIHIVTGIGTPVAAAGTGMPIAANCAEFISLPASNSIAHIRDLAETDGTIWFTKQ